MSTRIERLTFGHRLRFAVPPPPSRVAAALAHEPEPVRLTRISTWDWGWGGLLIFTVLLFFRPQDQIPGLGNSHVSDIAALIGLSAMAFINLSRGKPLTRVTPELLGVAALGGVILLTVPTSYWPGGSFGVFTDLFLTVALIFMLMVNTMTSPRRIEQIGKIIVLAFGYMCVRVIFDYARGVNLMEGRASGPVGGFFQNPNDLALNLVSFLPLALMYVKRPGPIHRRLLYAGISLLMLTAAILTKSRGGMLGLVAMLVTFLIVSRSLRPATIIAITFSGLVILPALPQSFWDRMASITEDNPMDGSREERKMLFRRGWGIFLEHPLTGVGAGQFRNYTSPAWPHLDRETHNVLLQVAAEIGILGLAAFLFLILHAFGAARWTRRELSWIYDRRRRKRGAAAGADPEDGLDESERLFLQTHGAALVAGLVGWFVTAFFLSVTYNWTIYYLLGLSVSARDVVRHRAEAYAEAKRRQQSGVVAA